jgi:hypothetical protein
MSSSRFKDRALGIERQVEEVGGLCLDILRAHCGDVHPYWVKESDLGPFKDATLDPLLYEAPAPKMAALPYLMHQVSDRMKVSVDSHSSSPIFSQEARQLALLLAKVGAIGPEEMIRQLAPPNEDELIADLETREAMKAAMIQSLPPEAQAKLLGAKGSSRRH